uniref:Uncharacterized protein n=1 Tax=Oryza punctata TaxID=4537 RepID=A0A0E0LM94_ORYPU
MTSYPRKSQPIPHSASPHRYSLAATPPPANLSATRPQKASAERGRGLVNRPIKQAVGNNTYRKRKRCGRVQLGAASPSGVYHFGGALLSTEHHPWHTKGGAPLHGRADTREETCLALVADETAAAHFLMWGAECDAFEPGDIVRLTGDIFSYHRSNSLVLRTGRRGRTEKVGEFMMLFVETPNMSEVK